MENITLCIESCRGIGVQVRCAPCCCNTVNISDSAVPCNVAYGCQRVDGVPGASQPSSSDQLDLATYHDSGFFLFSCQFERLLILLTPLVCPVSSQLVAATYQLQRPPRAYSHRQAG